MALPNFLENFLKTIKIKIAQQIMPAQTTPRANIAVPPSSDELQVREKNLPLSPPGTPQQVNINFCEFYSGNEETVPPNKIMIFAEGNADFYENHFAKYQQLAHDYPNVRIVAFNPRGVQKSTGQALSEQDWTNDIIKVIESYTVPSQENTAPIPTQDITLVGESLGAALVTIAAAEKYKKDQEANRENPGRVRSVNVINIRSFSSLSQVLLGHLPAPALGGIAAAVYGGFLALFSPTLALLVGGALFTGGFLGKDMRNSLTKLVDPLLAFPLNRLFGNMEAAKAYISLPDEAKRHIVLKGDNVIPTVASLHNDKEIKALRSARKINYRAALRATTEVEPNAQSSRVAAHEALREIKDCVLKVENVPLSHNLPLSSLFTNHKLRQRPSSPQEGIPEQINGKVVFDQHAQRLLRLRPRS